MSHLIETSASQHSKIESCLGIKGKIPRTVQLLISASATSHVVAALLTVACYCLDTPTAKIYLQNCSIS